MRREPDLVRKVREEFRDSAAMRPCDSYSPTQSQGAAVRVSCFLGLPITVTGGMRTHQGPPPPPPPPRLGYRVAHVPRYVYNYERWYRRRGRDPPWGIGRRS